MCTLCVAQYCMCIFVYLYDVRRVFLAVFLRYCRSVRPQGGGGVNLVPPPDPRPAGVDRSPLHVGLNHVGAAGEQRTSGPPAAGPQLPVRSYCFCCWCWNIMD